MMNEMNYQKACEEVLAKEDTKDKTLVLQTCCAPCASWCLTYLEGRIQVKSLFYNPNIVDMEEYEKREHELQRLIEALSKEYPDAHISFLEGNIEPERFLELAKGLEKEPEGGKRCEKCFRLRLAKAARVAKEIHADFFGTTLTISPLKDAKLINRIGEEIALETGVSFLPSDFKKQDGYKKSVELSKKYGLYRQDYCGCPFSKNERESRKIQ